MNCLKMTQNRHLVLSGMVVGTFFLGATLLSTTANAQDNAAAGDANLSVRHEEPTPRVQWSDTNGLVVSIRSATFETPDDSFDAFGGDADYTGGQVEVGYDFGATVVPGLRGYLIYSGGGYATKSRFGGQVDLGWRRDLLMVAADFGPELWGFFRPSIRFGGGYARQTLETEIGGIDRTGHDHGIAGFGAVSLEFFTPRGFFNGFQIGLAVEAGGLLQSSASFDEMQTDGGTNGDWSHRQVDLGELSASGRFVSAGAELIVPFD